MALPSADRRANPRIDINGEMTYRSGGSGETRQGEIENMSAGGALIWIAEELPVGSELLISVEEIDGDRCTLEFRAVLLHHVGANGSFEGCEDRYYQGNRPNGLYIPRFRNISPETRRSDYVRGFGFQAGASRPRRLIVHHSAATSARLTMPDITALA